MRRERETARTGVVVEPIPTLMPFRSPPPSATINSEAEPSMIDTVINLLFRCPHHRLTRPMAPITKAGKPHSQSYVVCLDCGKQFEYDLNEMRIGRPIDHSHEHAIVPPPKAASRGKKVAYGLMAVVPVAVLLGAVWKVKKKPGQQSESDVTGSGGKPRGGTG